MLVVDNTLWQLFVRTPGTTPVLNSNNRCQRLSCGSSSLEWMGFMAA